jgi:hypothetical protein
MNLRGVVWTSEPSVLARRGSQKNVLDEIDPDASNADGFGVEGDRVSRELCETNGQPAQ